MYVNGAKTTSFSAGKAESHAIDISTPLHEIADLDAHARVGPADAVLWRRARRGSATRQYRTRGVSRAGWCGAGSAGDQKSLGPARSRMPYDRGVYLPKAQRG